MSRIEEKKAELLFWAKKLYERFLVSGCSGNISSRLSDTTTLITCRGAYLGFLEREDLLLINNEAKVVEGKKETSVETPIHLAVYKRFPTNCLIHAHPNYSNAYFAKFDKVELFTFEAKFFLADIPVIPQQTPKIADLEAVLNGLERSNIVVLKNHGVLAMGEDFKEAFSYIEYLEEAAKANLLIRFSSRPQQLSPAEEKSSPKEKEKRYKMFSPQHMNRIVELINCNEDISRLGRQLEMTTNLAVKLDETEEVYNFHFVDGRIKEVSRSQESAEFVISGPEKYWRMIFNRQLDPFAATTQKKLKLVGDFGKISRWYVPCTKIFQIWKEVPIE